MSSCCGEPVGAKKEDENRQMTQKNQVVTQQPVPHPAAQFNGQNGFPHPEITSPPPGHLNQSMRGFENSQQQDQSFSPASLINQNASTTNTFASSNGWSAFSTQPLISPSPALRSPSPRANQTAFTSNPASTPQGQSTPAAMDEGTLSISIDFGTTFSGVAYGSSRLAGGKVQQLLHWPGTTETFRKIPTCLLYDEGGQVLAWGLEAKTARSIPGTLKCEWFKLYLEPHALRGEEVDPRLPPLPPNKQAIDLIIDFLTCLYEYAKEQITQEIGGVADLNSANVWLTVPAAWDARGCSMMRDAAIDAGLVQFAKAGDQNWKDRLKIITEPEAAAVHCAHLTDLHKLKASQNFMICDAGGGTVDLAIYKLIGQMEGLEIAEMCARSGANCGSLFLDFRFQELVKTLLHDHPAHLDPTSLASFMHSFSETDKLEYRGEIDDETIFYFQCFNNEDSHDPSVGLINGQLAIPGGLLREQVFDPIVSQALDLIEEQSRRIDQRIDALLLVGGFACCEYLYTRVQDQFRSRIQVIARPADADTATARGAAQYGLARKSLVTSVISPRSYLMKVKLPADAEDKMKRPAYIKNNNAGVAICENRLQYLVVKGAILRKGQRVTTKFCKFSQTAQDSLFVAVLYTSETDKIMRYTDEGETTELCKWTVDLKTLPSYQQNSSTQPNGFYTEFELGLELDSAEVRGILLYNGEEWGRVVFDFFN